MKLRKEIIPIAINGVTRKAEIADKKPLDAVKLNVKNSLYNFYEVVETVGEDTHHWTYAVAK